MKKFYMCLAAVLLALSLTFAACSKAENSEKTENTQNEKDSGEEEILIAPTEDPQIAIDNEMTLEYLSFLGLDETCSYTLGDTFPTGNGDDKSYLVNVTNISDEDFAAIQQALESNGFRIITDIMEDTEKQFKSFQYSNETSLYIEIGYSYGAEYFDVHFVPIS